MNTKTIFYASLLSMLAIGGLANADQADALQDWMDELTSSGGVLAANVVTMRGENVVHLASGVTDPGGPRPDPNTQFQIGSITKVFTNLLLAEAVENDVITYGTTVNEVVGDRISPANPKVGEITMMALATHTSGLPRLQPNFAPRDPLDPYADIDNASLYAGVNMTRAKQPLGSFYAYSNFAMGLSGHMLGIAYDSSYAEALETEILQPLGLRETGFVEQENRAVGFSAGGVVPAWTFGDSTAAAGALWGSTADLELFARILLGDTENPLAHDPQDNLDIVADDASGFAVTRVWHVAYAGDQPVYWHNGGTGGYASFFGFRPDTHQAVAILISGNHPPLQKGLELLGASAKSIEYPPVDETVFGEFQLTPQVTAGVFERNGRLYTQLSGQAALGLTPVGNDWYVIDNVDASLHFVRQDNAVIAAELAQGGVIQRAERIATRAAVDSRQEIAMSPADLDHYVGEYAINANAKFTIRKHEGGLEAKLTGQPFLPIYAAGDDVFFYKVVDAALHFERNDEGAIVALALKQGSIEQRASKTSD